MGAKHTESSKSFSFSYALNIYRTPHPLFCNQKPDITQDMPSTLQTLDDVKAADLQARTHEQLTADIKVWDGKWQFAKNYLEEVQKPEANKTADEINEAQRKADEKKEALKMLQKARKAAKDPVVVNALNNADTGSDEMISLAKQMITTAERQKQDLDRAHNAVEDSGLVRVPEKPE